MELNIASLKFYSAMRKYKRIATGLILARFLPITAPTHPKTCLFCQTLKWHWSLKGDVISIQSWHHPTETKQLSIIPGLYHPPVNQSQMLAHEVASVNTLTALHCNLAKKFQTTPSLGNSYKGNVWYSVSAERNGCLSLIVHCKALWGSKLCDTQ